MSYENTKEMLLDASKNSYVVGSFNIAEITTMSAVIEAASAKKSNVIMQTSQKTVKRFGYDILAFAAKNLSEKAESGIALSLDHGTDMEIIMNCINKGWSSVMIDGSSKPFEENISVTKEVVEAAHKKGLTVEGELGHIGGIEDHINIDGGNVMLTDPDKAVEFAERTGVDSLAVAIGTMHGLYKGIVKLDFERLEKILSVINIPIVIHGCSDLPPNDLKRLIESGPAKMNISTEIKHVYIDSHNKYFSLHPDEYEPVKAMDMVFENTFSLVSGYIEKFRSKGSFVKK